MVEQVADSLEKRQVKIEGLSEALEVDAPEGEPGFSTSTYSKDI